MTIGRAFLPVIAALAGGACERAETQRPVAPAAAPAPTPRRERAEGLSGLRGSALGKGDHALAELAAPAKAVALEAADLAPGGGEEAGGAEPPTRAWFPETFLFAPLVVTDDAGAATFSVRVPDRLTSWRVLALAHSRAGAQAGSEITFQGTLPTYVDPVVPAFLTAGDEVSLPIQVVNTTDQPVTAPLRVEVRGAALARALGPVRVEAAGSVVVHAPLRANRPGLVTLAASLGDRDAVERNIPVRPRGRPVGETRSGTLAAERTLEIALPAEVDRESASARLLVLPGALAILRAELAVAASRGEVADDAYALLLAGRGEGLVRRLGGEPDADALRALAVVAGQRALRAARAPDGATAALLAEAALAHPGNPVLARLGERLAATVAGAQRPDGTCGGEDGWTLQRLLVATADCVRAVRAAAGSPHGRQRAARMTLSARAAFERNLARIEDAYTAAAILASEAVDGEARDRLRRRVRDALSARPDGTRVLAVEAGIVRADGGAPSSVEATALAVLALAGDPEARGVLGDLGGHLLAAYDPARGFGDGRTNLAALAAVLVLFGDPLPERVTITLAQDGRPLATRVLEGPKLREVLALEAPLPDPGAKRTYTIRAEPGVPGLGYALTLRGFVPWAGPQRASGLELVIETPREARLGQPAEVTVRAAAPAGLALTIRHALPAGVQVDTASLDALVSAGTIRAYDREDGAVTLAVPAREAGAAFSARYRAIPTLAGRLGAGASSVTAGGQTQYVPPTPWTVR